MIVEMEPALFSQSFFVAFSTLEYTLATMIGTYF